MPAANERAARDGADTAVTIDEATRARRAAWQNRGAERPPFAAIPGPGQESVWDYPRPPVVVAEARRVEVSAFGEPIAASDRALRVLETASPPTVYVPESDVRRDRLAPGEGVSHCEWKGDARYWDVVVDPRRIVAAAWSYPAPYPEFEALAGYLAFYPSRVDCTLGGERVAPQPGRFYGGWVTPDVVGPFKGERGSEGW